MEAAAQGGRGLADPVSQETAVGGWYGVGAEGHADRGGRVAGVVQGGAGHGCDARGDEGILDGITLTLLVGEQPTELRERLRAVVGATDE